MSSRWWPFQKLRISVSLSSARAGVAGAGTLAALGGSAMGLAMLLAPAGPVRVAAPAAPPLPEPNDAAPPTVPVTKRREAAMTPLQDWWFGSLFGLGGGYRDNRPHAPLRRHRSHPASPSGEEGSGTREPRQAPRPAYRTMCVRLCDGYYFPISYSVSRERFAKDARTCEGLCSGEARLFVYRNPGEEADDMEDLEGKPYRQLRAAFLYRTEYVPGCKCRPHPWEKEARDRHRVYALAAAAKKGSKEAEKELIPLQESMRKVAGSGSGKKTGSEKKTGNEKKKAGAPEEAADEKAPARAGSGSALSARGGGSIMRLGLPGKPKAKPAPEPSSSPSASDWRARIFRDGN